MKTLGLYVLSFSLLVGCGGSSGDNPTNPAGGDAGSSTTDSAPAFEDTALTKPSADAGPSGDAGADGGCSATADDPLDDDGIDSNCDGADGKAGFDVYVNPTTGLDSNEGTPSSPKQTISAALMKARVTGGSVVVSTGDYPLDTLDAPGKWTIVGGYDKTFLGKPTRERTTFTVPASGLSISGTAVEGTFRHLQVVGASPDSADQPSAYAIRAKVERLSLDDVFVQSGDGLEGKSGALDGVDPGAAGSAGRDAVSSGSATDPPWPTCKGVPQPDYVAGKAGDSAVGGARGYVTSSGGVAGADGPNGAPGTDGENAPKAPALVDEILRWADGKSGLSDGKPGYGAAGAKAMTYWWMAATGGSGGCPGDGGNGGKSGGGSIAIMLLGGELKITRSAIKTGFAGNGGDGGAGGKGGAGGRGGWPIGATGPCPSGSTDCSGYGGKGGDGGKGGRGGGGAGGWTIGIVKVGTSKSDLDAATLFTLGAPGTGGLGKSGGYAPNGDKVREYAISP